MRKMFNRFALIGNPILDIRQIKMSTMIQRFGHMPSTLHRDCFLSISFSDAMQKRAKKRLCASHLRSKPFVGMLYIDEDVCVFGNISIFNKNTKRTNTISYQNPLEVQKTWNRRSSQWRHLFNELDNYFL